MDGLVLSHPEQLDRLRSACPEMVDAAVLAGDPCFDRMLAARRYRDRFRRALGVHRGQRLVVINSTWNPEGFFGSGQHNVLPGLLPRLTAELPADDYRLAAVLHPNIWFGHGPGQVRAWLDRAVRSGLTLIDPVHHWRQALLASDAVIGDFGAVSYYASALGTPVLIAATGAGKLDPEAPLAAFVERAPRLDPYGPLETQLTQLIAEHRPQPGGADYITSAPGRSAPLLRRHFYRLLNLPEPSAPALLEPLPLTPHDPPSRTAPFHVRTRTSGTDIVVARSTAQPYGSYDAHGETHLAVHEETRDPSALELADVITRYGPADDVRLGGAVAWATEVLRLYPGCSAAAYVTGPDGCLVRTQEHGQFQLTACPGSDLDPAAYASALHAWLAAGHCVPAGGITLHVHAAGADHPVDVTADRRHPHSAAAGPQDSAGVESRQE
ncbi:hypothetical protein [Streptomyces sp. NBC_00859]|uniref:hypothetical protein n=1 Tax=Streptomyces sp. NBC_00859 TaxID=2903682 RepID=UPI003866F30C|nr:hypothetical protein OG584_15355 [Streptomyces sp. NBC_00859]